MDDLFTRVADIFKQQMGVDVTPDTDFIRDLQMDSLDIVEIVMNLEEELNLSIPDDVIGSESNGHRIETVGQLVDWIRKEQAKP
jgi:acyl carrier protein